MRVFVKPKRERKTANSSNRVNQVGITKGVLYVMYVCVFVA